MCATCWVATSHHLSSHLRGNAFVEPRSHGLTVANTIGPPITASRRQRYRACTVLDLQEEPRHPQIQKGPGRRICERAMCAYFTNHNCEVCVAPPPISPTWEEEREPRNRNRADRGDEPRVRAV